MNEQEIANSAWKEKLIAEYANVERNKQATHENVKTLAARIELEEEIVYKQDQLERLKQPYLDTILECEQRQTGIKEELVKRWDIEDKTFKCDAGTATLRTTKSLVIRDKNKLIDFLSLNKKLTEYVKAFDTSKLRKIRETGLIGNDVIDWDEKKSMMISVKESE